MHRVKRRTNIKKEHARPRQDSNLELSDPKSDALSIRPRAQDIYSRISFITFDNREVQIPTVPCFLTCLQFMLCSRSKL